MGVERQSSKGGPLSDQHLAALAEGRRDGHTVRAYLEALEAAGGARRRGRQRTKESIERRLQAIEAEIVDASVVVRLQLIQERNDLQSELASKSSMNDADLEALRVAFVKVARHYGERKGIGYAAWREIGVDTKTLREAGISR